MRKISTNYVFIFPIILSLLIVFPAYAQSTGDQLDAVLTPAESFFKSLKGKDYTKIWTLLSQKSQETIVDDVFKEILKNQSSQTTAVEYSREQILADFKVGGSLSKSYWNSFLEYFSPDLVLDQSKWDIGTVKKDKAEISIQYKKSDNPALLKMFKENNAWKVGLVETFWTRK
ncbi:MAG: hypothetical protein NTX36_11310 [Proteobacteria bacterium]|nr:hypothetical protein [Pseudomonadota bacterium]